METTTSTEPSPEGQKRSLLQWRPKDGKANTRDAFYSPARDLAYIGPEIIKRAMSSLDGTIEPWLAEFLVTNNVTIDTLIETKAPLKFATAVNQIIKAASPVDAVEASGFAELPAAIQLLIYARIGQVMLAATWSCVKDVSAPDSSPPAAIEDILQAAEDALKGLGITSA